MATHSQVGTDFAALLTDGHKQPPDPITAAHLTQVQHHNHVGVYNGRQSVGHNEGSTRGAPSCKRALNTPLRQRVQRTGGLPAAAA
jgi:hypothetical protein